MAQQGMPNLIDLYKAASSGFRNTLTGVKADQMGNGTPCSQWNVQQLIKHNINVTGFVRGVFAGNVNVNPMDVSGPLPSNGALEGLDGGLVEFIYSAVLPHMDDIRKVEVAGMPIFAAAVPVPDSASTQDKLLGMLGRKP